MTRQFATVRWDHPRTKAPTQVAGELVHYHPSGRVTVRIVCEGREYLVTASPTHIAPPEGEK